MQNKPSAKTLEARRLHAEGELGYRRIGQRLGMTRDQVRSAVRDDRARRRRRRMRLGNLSTRRRWDAERAIIVLLWHDGATLREIAERLKLSVSAVDTRMVNMRREGYDLPNRIRPRRTDEERAVIAALWRDEATGAEIAERIGTTVQGAHAAVQHMRSIGYDLPHRRRV